MKMIKLSEEMIGEKLSNFGFYNEFLDTTPIQERKIDKLDYIKIKNFYPAKDTVENEKASHGLRENICKGYIC